MSPILFDFLDIKQGLKNMKKFFSTFLKFGAVVDLRQLIDQSIGEEIILKKREKPFKNHLDYTQQSELF